MVDGNTACAVLENALSDADVPYERFGWDWYDNSVELHDVPSDYRLTIEAQRIIYDAGFELAYVNHTDKWETHYRFNLKKPFVESAGWRVSYPHKRGETGGSIWVEAVVSGWPSEWFDTGYCVVKDDPSHMTDEPPNLGPILRAQGEV